MHISKILSGKNRIGVFLSWPYDEPCMTFWINELAAAKNKVKGDMLIITY